jgi:hypothetical protein
VNRAERRTSELTLIDFAAAPGGSAFVARIIEPTDIARLLRRAMRGDDPDDACALQAIARWLAIVTEASPGQRPTCLDCSTEFAAPDRPAAIAVVMPFGDPSRALVTGICPACATRGEDLMDMLIRRARELWPGVRKLPDGGHA